MAACLESEDFDGDSDIKDIVVAAMFPLVYFSLLTFDLRIAKAKAFAIWLYMACNGNVFIR